MKSDGLFGPYGGFYVSELLIPNLEEVERAWLEAREDPDFQAELQSLLRDFAGRPTPLYRSGALSAAVGCEVYLKREDLLHGGAHKTNNTIAQALLAKRMGKRRLIAETGAGQHGVATAMAGALLGLDVEIFMGAKDVARQRPNVLRMELFGAKVRPVTSGAQTLKDAINDTLRYWTETLEESFYVFGTVAGPHPFPSMVKDFQRVIGEEARAQSIRQAGALPAAVVACVGGGSNAMGIFAEFIPDAEVSLIGVEPGGEGIASGHHGAPLGHGTTGCLHGAISAVLQDADGQIQEAHSVSAGLDYPGVGPEHAWLRDTGRATYVSVTDDEALDAFQWLSRNEGIIPALESSHAVAHVLRSAGQWRASDIVVINLSGRGDKDLEHVERELKARSDGGNGAHGAAAQEGRVRAASTPVDWPEPGKAASPASSHGPERLRACFASLRERDEAAFMPFVVVGDPDPVTSGRVVDALVEAGADLLEFGFAFSDPPADGPVIQAADVRALDAGATTERDFAFLGAVRERHPDVPVALLVYANIVMRYGVERFYESCARVGVDAVLVADVPLEAAGPFVDAARANDVAPIFIASAITRDDRLERIAELGSGYLYAVARLGTTGEQSEVSASLGDELARFASATGLPVLAGFGISTPAHVARVVEAGADGVICGSALVRRIAEHGDDPDAAVAAVRALATQMKAATRRTHRSE